MTGQVIHSDARGVVAELVFRPHSMVALHDNPNTTLFIVISGGGYVQVGTERARVNHGEAVVWPAGVIHGAYTEGTEMRAIVVEFRGADDAWVGAILGGAPLELPAGERVVDHPPVSPAEGRLAEQAPARGRRDESSGEPW